MQDIWIGSYEPQDSQHTIPVQDSHQQLLRQPHDVVVAPKTINASKRTAAPSPCSPSITRRAESFCNLQVTHDRHGYIKGSFQRRRSSATQCEDSITAILRQDAWSYEMEDELIESSHSNYQLYKDETDVAQLRLTSLLESTNASLNLLATLSESFKVVETQTSAFQAQCQSLLTEQKRMTKLADDVKENLRYYDYLEPITRRLNAPGAANLVRGNDFSDMLANLDACLDYMQAHPELKEAGVYQTKYRLLLTRALTLIRVHFTESLRSLAATVSQHLSDGMAKNQTTLLYARFRVIAPELKRLGIEIQKRAVLPADAEQDSEPEYQSLMNELYQSYTSARGRLILPIVAHKMTELAASTEAKKDVVAFAREAMVYVRGMCLDEYALWQEWFEGDAGVYEFLEAICEPLYDQLRPRTIHEVKLTKLCELCAFVQSRYIRNEEDDDGDDADDLSSEVAAQDLKSRELNFAALIQPALGDAQTRLVFLALAALRDDIERYKPSAQDFENARKARSAGMVNGKPVALSGRRSSFTPVVAVSPRTATGEESAFETQLTAGMDSQNWYPTLPKAVRLLSRIYRLVNSSVFDDLAHRIVYSTSQSLESAATQIRAKSGMIDSDLFLISQLLGLKQQIVAFDIEFVTTEVSFDFSNVTNTFYELRDRGGLWNPATWYKLASGGLLPRVVENMLDAKADLDGRLRRAINELVTTYASNITAPLTELNESKGQNSGKTDDVRAQRATTAVRGLVEKEVVALRGKLDEYMSDARTKETLIAAVRDQVVTAYEDWIAHYNETLVVAGLGKLGKVSRKGKGREDEVWGSDVFAEWCEKVFHVQIEV